MQTVQIAAEIVSQVETGSKTVGTTASQLGIFTGLTRGVEILALSSNTARIYVSTKPTVTAGSSDGRDGFCVEAGQSIFFPCTSLAQVYVVANNDNQVLSFLAY